MLPCIEQSKNPLFKTPNNPRPKVLSPHWLVNNTEANIVEKNRVYIKRTIKKRGPRE